MPRGSGSYIKNKSEEKKKIKTETPGKSGGYKKQLGGGKRRRREEGREESPRDTTKDPHAAPTLRKASSHGSSAGPRALGRGWGFEGCWREAGGVKGIRVELRE